MKARTRIAIVRLAPVVALSVVGPSLPSFQLTAQAPQATANDLDAFMARVLERREESWRRLHDYVLDEREQFAIVGPGRVRLHGLDREFTWYVRDGFFVRSPVRANGVAVPDGNRRRYEDRWFDREKAREARRQAKQAGDEPGAGDESTDAEEDLPVDADSLVRQGGEPRFISEAYFLKFRFEPGNYYLVGRESLDGRQVLRIEYYPQRLFSRTSDGQKEEASGQKSTRKKDPGDVDEADLDRKFDKVALITLWVDPSEHQIVRYTFDNMGLDFLPGRWLVRFDDLHASMTMGRYFDSVWLPREIRFEGGLTLASGSYTFDYVRAFSDYRQAETKAIIRGYSPKEP